ncbi:hypothetical protein CHS0354_020578, partial [Potamilus streckersoni]
MKRFSPSRTQYPDPSKPPDGEETDENRTEGSKKVKTNQSFESLFDNETLSDVIIKINNGQYMFNAHKMILGMKSDFLAAKLNELPPCEKDEKPVLCIEEPPECSEVFSRFLYFIYSGAVWLHRDYVIALQRLADKYAVRPLLQHCESYITQILNDTLCDCDNLQGFPMEVICDIQEGTFQSEEVRNLAFQVLCVHFRRLVQSDRWKQCNFNLVCNLLKNDTCQAEENVILTSATDWMKKNNLNDKSRIEDILINIRYPMLNRRVLYHLQKNGAFSNFPRVQELVNNAIKYHCFKDIPEAMDEFVGAQYQARIHIEPMTTTSNNNHPASPAMRYTNLDTTNARSQENMELLNGNESVSENTNVKDRKQYKNHDDTRATSGY